MRYFYYSLAVCLLVPSLWLSAQEEPPQDLMAQVTQLVMSGESEKATELCIKGFQDPNADALAKSACTALFTGDKEGVKKLVALCEDGEKKIEPRACTAITRSAPDVLAEEDPLKLAEGLRVLTDDLASVWASTMVGKMAAEMQGDTSGLGEKMKTVTSKAEMDEALGDLGVKANDQSALADLRNGAVSEEVHYVDNDRYISCGSGPECEKLLPAFMHTPGVTISFSTVDGKEFTGSATHEKGSGKVFRWDSAKGGLQK